MKQTFIRTTWALVAIMLISTQTIMAQTFVYPEYEDLTERIAVHFDGQRPTISDFATALLDNRSSEHDFFGMVNRDWKLYQEKKPLSTKAKITLDTKNGYMRYDTFYPEKTDTTFLEMCYWNCADGKHKLVCLNTVWVFDNDYGWADYIGASFFLYDNAKKNLRMLYLEDIGALYDGDGLSVFFLPRKGKNIRVSAAGGGDRWDEVLEWDGYQFHSREVK